MFPKKTLSLKKLPGLNGLTSTLNPKTKVFTPKKKVPVFKILASGLNPATRVLLRKPKTSKRPLNIIEIAKRLHLNANGKKFSTKNKKNKQNKQNKKIRKTQKKGKK